MKTAVSIPDAVFEAAERLAARRRCSRSSLYTEALERMLAAVEGQEVTARLNAVYEKTPSEVDSILATAQERALGHGAW